jgi:hypothetical protein
MKKLALALAATAALGFAAPAFAADSDMSGPKAQTQAPAGQSSTPSAQTQTPSAQTPAAQADVKSKAKVSAKATDHKAKMVHGNRGVNKLAQHDRGLHRGFTHGRYYAYAKPHHKSVHHSKTMTQH